MAYGLNVQLGFNKLWANLVCKLALEVPLRPPRLVIHPVVGAPPVPTSPMRDAIDRARPPLKEHKLCLSPSSSPSLFS